MSTHHKNEPNSLSELTAGLGAPDHVAFGVGDAADPAPLPQEAEEALIHPRAAAVRRDDFRRGRHAAHLALRELGVTDAPILRGDHNEPLWPGSVVGSITHGSGFALAAAARRIHYEGIGIDLEHRDRYFPGLADQIAFGEECDWLNSLPGDERRRATLEVFSAKESIYKALFPSVGRYFGFSAARVLPAADPGRLRAHMIEPIHPRFTASVPIDIVRRWKGDLLVTAVFLASGDQQPVP